MRKYKAQQLENIVRDGINRKYKISFAKGMQFALETLILLVLMCSVVLKANIFSLFYLAFIFKYITSRGKAEMLVRIATYMSVAFVAQYALFVLNLTDGVSPSKFPQQMHGYPASKTAGDYSIKYAIPLFF